MPVPASPVARVLRFGPFELDPSTGELRKAGVKLRLQGQPIQLLGILIENAGTLVTREELKRQLWPGDTFVDFDHGLHNAVARIRETLGDSVGTPKYIETLPRRGYRFIAPVEDITPLPQAAVSSDENAVGTVPIATAPPTRRTGVILMVCACFAIGLAASSFAWRRFAVEGAATPTRSIAVLPLKNLSGSADEDYFADAMTDELITELSQIQALKVISHTSVMEYKSTTKHLPQIARELGVDDVVEGSVTRDGDRVRVTVQLLDAPNDRHLWSESYQRPLNGILDLQNEIAQTIAQQIRVKLTADRSARRASSVDPEAYDAYLRGRYYLNTQYSTLSPVITARRYFEESIRKDPGFARSYAGLADAQWNLASFRHLSAESAYRSASEVARKALDLDQSLGEAHMTRALFSWRYEWDWKAAEREFEYAIALAPSNDTIRCYHSNYLAWRGRRADAVAELTKSRELNPGASFSSSESAIYFQLRDYPGLVRVSQAGVHSDPNEWLEHFFLGMGYEGVGRRAEAIPEYRKAVEISGGDQDATAALAHAYAMDGRTADAKAILRDLEQKHDGYVSPYMIATIHAGLGDKDRAFEYLTKAYQERCLDIVWQLQADHRIDNLRSDPRFQTLLRHVNFP